MATSLTTEIHDALTDHILISGDNEAYNVYDMWAPIELKSILEEAHVKNSVYIHPTGVEGSQEPDMWCSVTWDSAGHLETIGFCYMSEKRTEEFMQYQLWLKGHYKTEEAVLE